MPGGGRVGGFLPLDEDAPIPSAATLVGGEDITISVERLWHMCRAARAALG